MDTAPQGSDEAAQYTEGDCVNPRAAALRTLVNIHRHNIRASVS